jgi:hypothetical protein
MKIREGLTRDDYRDPGPYRHPPGTVAYEVEAPDAAPARQSSPATAPTGGRGSNKPMKGMKM